MAKMINSCHNFLMVIKISYSIYLRNQEEFTECSLQHQICSCELSLILKFGLEIYVKLSIFEHVQKAFLEFCICMRLLSLKFRVSFRLLCLKSLLAVLCKLIFSMNWRQNSSEKDKISGLKWDITGYIETFFLCFLISGKCYDLF